MSVEVCFAIEAFPTLQTAVSSSRFPPGCQRPMVALSVLQETAAGSEPAAAVLTRVLCCAASLVGRLHVFGVQVLEDRHESALRTGKHGLQVL